MRIRILFIVLSATIAAIRSEAQSLKISRITGDTYVYTTFQDYGGSLFPSNSMYVVTDEGVVLIDTPWDTTQIEPLIDSIKRRHNKEIIASISTHFHDDRVGGVDILKALGIKTYSSSRTISLCRKKMKDIPAYAFASDTTFTFGQHKIQTYFPGEGHTADNIVVWIANEQILFGGCLVKSTESKGMGNIADANLSAWPGTISKVIQTFPRRNFVIPGHQSWDDEGSLEHTLELLRKHKTN